MTSHPAPPQRPDGEPTGDLVAARDLCAVHIGAEAYLNGRHEHEGVLDGRLVNPRWVKTWAPITMIQAHQDGTVKVRRHPDAHTDHTLHPDEMILLRHQPTRSGLDEARAREATLREELEDAWVKAVAAAEPDARITHGQMPPFIPATWLRAILDDPRSHPYDVATIRGPILLASVVSTIVDVLTHHDWANSDDPELSAAHVRHRYDGRCAVCRHQLDRVAMTVAHRLADLNEALIEDTGR